jgi:hypothetical protein
VRVLFVDHGLEEFSQVFSGCLAAQILNIICFFLLLSGQHAGRESRDNSCDVWFCLPRCIAAFVVAAH